MIIRSALTLLTVLTFSNTNALANDIYVSQVGDDYTITIVQDGDNNKIGSSLTPVDVDGNTNTLTLKQWDDNNEMQESVNGNRNTTKVLQGRLSGRSADNYAEVDVTRDVNIVTVLQDRNDAGNDDPTAVGDHETYITVFGDNNNVWQAQRNNGTWGTGPDGHYSTIDITGDYANIDVVQQADVKKTLSIDIDADYVTADIRQNGHGQHDITLDVDNSNSTFDLDQGYNPGQSSGHSMSISTGGTYASDITVLQESNTAQSYTLTQTCVNSNGCSVSVTQN